MDSLCREGYLTAVREPADRRIMHLKLSERAGRSRNGLRSSKKELAGKIECGITPEELRITSATLDKLLINTEQLLKGKKIMLNNSTSKNAGSGISKEADLGHDKIGKLLFNLAFPAILAQIINVLYNMVDRMYIGHIEHIGPDALTGVGVTMPVIVYLRLRRSGEHGRRSQGFHYDGKGRNDQAEKILGNCTSMLLIISITLTTLFLLFGRSVLLMFGASEKTIVYAWAYMEIYACGTIFVQLALGLNAFINAQGYAKIGMMTVAIGAVCNIILDPIFIFALNMGVRGRRLGHNYLTGRILYLDPQVPDRQKKSSENQTSEYEAGSGHHRHLRIAGPCAFIMQFTESAVRLL